MKKLFIFSMFLLGVGAQAQNNMMPIHGGLGFLYTDFNNFVNPAHLGMEKGSALQGAYTNGNGSQTGTPSFASSNGKIGFEAFGTRTADSLTNPTNAVDEVGAELGFMLGKGAALGVSYQKTITNTSTNSGVAAASLELHGAGGMDKGIGFAVGASTMISSSVQSSTTGTVALGWSFKQNNNIEAQTVFNDINNFHDFNLSGVLTLGSQVVYFSGAYTWVNLTQTSKVAGRLGFNLGSHVDISGTVGYTLNSSLQPIYGGTFRVSF